MFQFVINIHNIPNKFFTYSEYPALDLVILFSRALLMTVCLRAYYFFSCARL